MTSKGPRAADSDPPMDTFNKIQVAERDERFVTKTVSGGVAEPSDLAHYPALTSVPIPRASAHFESSFKEALLAEDVNEEAEIITEASSHKLQPIEKRGAAGARTADPSISSPRIAAGRTIIGVPGTTPKATEKQVTDPDLRSRSRRTSRQASAYAVEHGFRASAF